MQLLCSVLSDWNNVLIYDVEIISGGRSYSQLQSERSAGVLSVLQFHINNGRFLFVFPQLTAFSSSRIISLYINSFNRWRTWCSLSSGRLLYAQFLFHHLDHLQPKKPQARFLLMFLTTQPKVIKAKICLTNYYNLFITNCYYFFFQQGELTIYKIDFAIVESWYTVFISNIWLKQIVSPILFKHIFLKIHVIVSITKKFHINKS